MEMSQVNVVKEDYGDKSAKCTASLRGLHILDSFAKGSLHRKILTVSKHTDKIVQLDMRTFDFFSMSYPGYDRHISVAIVRPEITLLFRVVGQLQRYAALFGVLSKTDATSAAATKDLPTKDGRQAVTRGPTRVRIVLDHPVLKFPRSSLSQERMVADLGMIEMENMHIPVHSDGYAPAKELQEWHINFKQMKLETFSESGYCSVVTEKIDGQAKAVPSTRKPGEPPGPDVHLEVLLGEVVGNLTDAQYALLLSIFGQNMTERYINGTISSAVNADPIENVDWDIAREISFKQLADQVAEALSDMHFFLKPKQQIVIKVEKLNLALLFAGEYGLDAARSSLIPLVQAVGNHAAMQFITYTKLSPDTSTPGREYLKWQLQTTCARLQVKDSRPAMSDRALAFISTEQRPKELCFVLVLSKTSSENMCVDVEFRRVEIVADAGLLLKCLSWMGEGGKRAKTTAVSEQGDYHYLLVQPGGLAVRTALTDARIHLVTSFEEAHADGFVVEATVSVYYAQVFPQFQITCRVEDMTVASSRSSSAESSLATHATFEDVFKDFEESITWKNMQIVKPCSLYYTLAWSAAAGLVPNVTTFETTGCDAVLSHEDVEMLSIVLSTLAASMHAADDGVIYKQGEHAPPNRKPAPSLLEIEAEIGTLKCALVAKSQVRPWMHLKVEGVIVHGKRMLDECYSIEGSLGSVEIIDASVFHTAHPKILTGCDFVDAMVSFKILTYDTSSALNPGYGLAVKVSVTRPKITMLWRFITSLNVYLASFRAAPQSPARKHIKSHVPKNSSNISAFSKRGALPFEMPPDFSPFQPYREPETFTEKKSEQPGKIQVKSDSMLIEIELHNPVVIIPRNSLVQEAFVADLGKMEVRNSAGGKSSKVREWWQVSLENMRIDTLSEAGKQLKFVDKVNGSAKLTFYEV